MNQNKDTGQSSSREQVNTDIWINMPDAFNFKTNLDYLQRDANECMYEVRNGVITRVIDVEGLRMLVQISESNKRQLIISFLTETHPETVHEKAAVVDYICDWFDLNRNITPFYKMAKKDPLLKQTINKFYGLRIIGIPDLFEALCWGILGQQINLGFAYTLKRQFVEKYGDSIVYKGKVYWIFPTYEEISKLKPEDLSDIKMTFRKREYIVGIAQLMVTGDLSKEKLLELEDFKTIEKELVKIRGIGPWTANYVLMHCLRSPSAFPIADVGLMNSIKYLQGMDQKPTKEEMLKLAEPWKDWEAYATFYLWRMLY